MSRQISAIAVFLGSNFGGHEAYRHGAMALGAALAQRGITLVYGGTNKGLMGVLADAVLAGGGKGFHNYEPGTYTKEDDGGYYVTVIQEKNVKQQTDQEAHSSNFRYHGKKRRHACRRALVDIGRPHMKGR